MARGDPQINLRLPPDLKEWLEERAERNVRSLTGEIAFMLRKERDRESKTAGDASQISPS